LVYSHNPKKVLLPQESQIRPRRNGRGAEQSEAEGVFRYDADMGDDKSDRNAKVANPAGRSNARSLRRNNCRNRLTLANAGHLGGVLVHGHGVQAPITAPTSMGTVIDGANNETHDDDDDD
tara:strand:+ start:1351 stop:1713 length:363 start_codon:yes stop_codon:yes gene_type:complete